LILRIVKNDEEEMNLMADALYIII
jgi:hypothetical protein